MCVWGRGGMQGFGGQRDPPSRQEGGRGKVQNGARWTLKLAAGGRAFKWPASACAARTWFDGAFVGRNAQQLAPRGSSLVGAGHTQSHLAQTFKLPPARPPFRPPARTVCSLRSAPCLLCSSS
jgi:hypothetical protein